MVKDSYENWDKNSPDRFTFETLVRRATFAITMDQWEDVLQVISANVDNTKDFELRVDMLGLVEFMLTSPELKETMGYLSEIVLKFVLIPSTVWKIGKPNVKIRKASVICMIKMV